MPASKLRFYDGSAHRGVFGLGKFVGSSLAAEDRVITDANPIFYMGRN